MSVIDWDAVYADRIQPCLAVTGGGVSAPRWIFVCGQQGSGKSTLVRAVEAELGPDCTQQISGDALLALLPDLPSLDRDRHLTALAERLVQHATRQRAHILWELPTPGAIEGLALVARSLGYQVECLILSLPALDSWLATLRRSLATPGAQVVPWANVQSTARRWPALIARAEDAVLFDRLAVIDRQGQTCFANLRTPQGRWAETPFAFESLVIERARARPAAEIASLFADWQGLRSDPALDAFCSCREAVDSLVQRLAADPGTSFDLNRPTASHPSAAAAWIARLRADLDDILAGPQAQGQTTLPARCDRLMALVQQVAGLPPS
ncbi:zeta toxin family protein [Tabrizicola aquatica]|uniref:zeta toxin family protein n=1 Tax=Tabrizicola aquatica TaxID=909926 RepID=UPI0015E18CCC|nr:zeta toxin family protein [Tabrizicola aquatica]